MCGIVGYIGTREASGVLVEGLGRLEYRGYDSAGVEIFDGHKLVEKKYKGRLAVLEEQLAKAPVWGTVGIGHTRWATHGAPSDENSHPHSSNDHKISLVHNGIIENYLELKEQLLAEGCAFHSETDTEVIVHLVRKYYDGNLLEAVMKAVSLVRGAYALAVICEEEPDELVAVRKDSPLIIGLGEGENFIASDIPAILEYTRDVYLIEDNTFAVVRRDGVQLFDENKNPIHKDVFHVHWSAEAAGKGGYDHFMLKEIHEQPEAVQNTLRGRISADSDEITLDDFNLTKEQFDQITKIYIVACGTAYYAGAVGKLLIEKYARKSVDMDIASEFRYKNPIIDEHTLFIAVSQSGETADTLASMRLAKSRGARILAVTNVVGSTVAREAQDVLYTWAGPEIAVASTKAYSTQVICMYLTALKLGQLAGTLTKETFEQMRKACLALPQAAEKALSLEPQIKEIAKGFTQKQDAFFIGRGMDYCLALEGSLKMKEISYLHAEAYQGGELKHGPIALIEEGTPVIAVCTQTGEMLEKILSNIKEVKARGAHILVVAQEATPEIVKTADVALYTGTCFDDATVIPAVIVLQLLAYYVATLKGCDVDKPRNLAKSVTVE